MSALLQMRGLDPAASNQAAIGILSQTLTRQAIVIAFDTASLTLVLIFVVAAPVVIGVKVGLSRALCEAHSVRQGDECAKSKAAHRP